MAPIIEKRPITWRMLLTVEPVLFLYAFGLFLNGPVSQQYIYYRLSEAKGFPYHFQKQTGCDDEVLNSSMKKLEKEVQTDASYVQLGITMFSALPSILITLFMGGWSDKVGRRPALIAPILGSAIESIVVLVVMYQNLPIYLLFVGGFAHGLCGYYTAVILACMSYVADTTEEKSIALRLGVIELLVFSGGTVAQLTSGLWIERFGFIAPYWFMLGCLTAGLFYAVFFVPESRVSSSSERGKLFSLDNIKSSFVVYRSSVGYIRRNLILLSIATGILAITIMGISDVINLFTLHSPLCFSPEYVGYFSAFRQLMYGAGGVSCIKLFGMCVSYVNVSRISILSYAGFLVYLGFSKTTPMVFTSPVIGVFGGAAAPVFRAMMSNIVSPDHQGSLFSAVSSLEMLCTFAGTAVFNSMYPKSLKFNFPGFVFLLAAGLLVLPFMFTCFLKDQVMFKARTTLVSPTSDYEKLPETDEERGEANDKSLPSSASEDSPISSPEVTKYL